MKSLLRRVFWPLLPFVLLVAQTATGLFFLRSATTLACALAVLFNSRTPRRGIVVAGLLVSLVADVVLGHSHGRTEWFLCGLSLFLVAHLLLIAFCLSHGRPRPVVAVFILIPLLLFYVLMLRPGIDAPAMRCGVLAYTMVTGLSLSAAWGLKPTGSLLHVLFLLGILSLAFSDTLIALRLFCGIRGIYFLMLPTYLLSHCLVTLALETEKGSTEV